LSDRVPAPADGPKVEVVGYSAIFDISESPAEL